MRTDVYEHLIQRYGEEISQNAEDFMTPKDVARLTTELLFANEDTLLNADRFEGRTFSYQLVNPSYGKKWKKEKEKDTVLEEMGRGFEDRFGAGKPDIDDESMLFMQNVAAKMASPEEGGGKEAIVLSGSLLVNGYAGSGPSSIRRWLFSEDLVDCVVKLSAEIFYRTGIATYICVLNDHKPENRKGYCSSSTRRRRRPPCARARETSASPLTRLASYSAIQTPAGHKSQEMERHAPHAFETFPIGANTSMLFCPRDSSSSSLNSASVTKQSMSEHRRLW